MISQSTIDEVKNRAEADIVTIISDYVQLKNQGANHLGLCPFHHEKTPSFSVNPDRKMFYCFGCHKGGGIVNFIMEIEKLNYPEAVEHLAKRLGVPVVYTRRGPEDDGGRQGRLDELAELYRRMAVSFHHFLMKTNDGAPAKRYIMGRGIEEEVIERFRLGYSPVDHRWMRSFLEKKGYSEDFLSNSGLFSKNNANFPIFTGRLMFPIADRQGKTVAFGGRSLPGIESGGRDGPKYINSPASDLYQKRETLYALDLAIAEIKRTKEVYLAEGYLDVIAMHQAGIENTVAPLGTAFTTAQAKLLRRWAEKVCLVFDTDKAGQEAAVKAILTCRNNALSCAVVDLQGGIDASRTRAGSGDAAGGSPPDETPQKDPADILKNHGKEALKKGVKCFINDFEYILNRSRALFDFSDSNGKSRGVAYLFPYLETLESEIARNDAIDVMADFFDVEPRAVKRDFERYSVRKDAGPGSRMEARDAGQAENTRAVRMTDELFLLIAMMVNSGLYPKLRSQFFVDDLESKEAKEIFIALEDWFRNDSPGMDDLLNRIEDLKLREFVIEKSGSGEYSQNPEQIIADGIKRIKQKRLEKRRKEIILELRVGKDQKEGYINDLLSEKVHIDAELCRFKEDNP